MNVTYLSLNFWGKKNLKSFCKLSHQSKTADKVYLTHIYPSFVCLIVSSLLFGNA